MQCKIYFKVVAVFIMLYFPLMANSFYGGKMSMKVNLESADTIHVLAESDSLFINGKLCYGKQEYLEAINWFLKSDSVIEVNYGIECPYYGYGKMWASCCYHELGMDSIALEYGTYYDRQPIDKLLTHSSDSVGWIALRLIGLGQIKDAAEKLFEAAMLEKIELGPNNYWYANTLSNCAGLYKEMRNFEKAIELMKEAVEIHKTVFGVEHINHAYSLVNLAALYSDFGNNNEALRLGTEAIRILKRNVGTDDSNYATSLSNLAYYNFEVGNYREAIRLETETTEILKKIIGTDNPNYATSLNRLTDYYTYLGNYNEALQIGTEAIGIIKKNYGTEHPIYARCLSSLSRLNSELGNYIRAINLETEALEINKKVFGIKSSNYATSLNNLATYYVEIGNFTKAISLETEALEIYKCIYGTEHPNNATFLNNLAQCNSELGNYSEAIRLGTEAMEIRKRILGTDHLDYAMSLNNLALDNSHIGNYSEAIRLGTEATEIYKTKLGTEHPLYATSLYNLAIYNANNRNYNEAIRLGTEAMEIRKRILGTDHPDYATSLNSLAVYYSRNGDYIEAVRFGTKAKEIRERVFGVEHPLYATSLLNLAGYYSELINYNEAIKLGTEAMDILKRILGTEHPFYIKSLDNLAMFYMKQGVFIEGFNCLQQCLNISQSVVLRNFTELSSHLQETMWSDKHAYKFNIFLPNIVTKCHTEQSISELYNMTCLFAKSILLNTGIQIRKLILQSGDSALIDKYKALAFNISVYNRLIETPIDKRFVNADSLNNVIQRQEMELAKESKVYGDYTHNLTITWKDVQRKLGDNDIAIEFLDFPIYNSDSTMYVALTLKKEYDSPHMVTLFEEKQLKAISEDVYYTQTDVSNLIWKPLEEELKGVRNIYFAPSGELHRIGIEYLPISKTENISEAYSLHRLTSTRQLAIIRDKSEGKKSILYGGINYDEKSRTILTDSTSVDGAVLRYAFSRANVDSLSLRSSFDYLEGTKREADMIADNMKQHRIPYIYYSGIDGSEETFKHLDGTKPQIMHIATHGFFLTEKEAKKTRFARPEVELMIEGFPKSGRLVEDKPMTRSGLLFSGCNRAFRHEQIPEGEEDGILTAQEISLLDLRGLDLVVLSACQTGLGDIISGEGAFGLQRGFKKAGANTIVMSLDKVDDEATRILMVEFYRNLMSGKTKRQSFQEAQQYLRKVDNGKYDNPKFWASFIMLDGLN